ncbi:MAG: peptidyl-prolyl cis-trans isomerase [Myxococcales bacterium]|nr:peptidyl-prolyl cis-trans isomerase [Myxococcales bacterium]
MRAPWTAALAALALAGLGCPEQAKPQQDPNVVATINGEVVPRSDFERELSRELNALGGTHARTPEEIEPFKRALLDTLVERTVLLQAARAANVAATPEEVDRRVLRLGADYPAESFEEAMAQGQTSLTELKRKTAQLIAIEKLFEEHVYPRVAVTEDEIRRYYEAHAEELQEPEQVHAAQIVVKGLDDARRVQSLLRSGKKFPDLARRYSLSPEAKLGGDLGFFARGVMPPQFDEVVFRLSVNQVSDVVTTDYGFHLFKVLERKPARKRELPEARREVEEKVLQEKRARAQEEYVRALKEKADIRVNEQVLLAVTGKVRPGSAAPEP